MLIAMRRFCYFAWVVCAVGLLATPAAASTLFFDDFTAGTLNTTNWGVGTWQLGRTQLGNTPTLAGGVATLRLDTYNPANTTLLRGSEIYTNASFTPGSTGIDLEARVRTNMTAAGAVTSLFTYTGGGVAGDPSYEIDYEILTKQLAQNKVLATTWNNWTETPGQSNDGIHHQTNDPTNAAGQTPAGADLTQWNTLRIRWLPTSTEWYVNDVLFYQTANAHPTTATPLRLNFWAPNSNWTSAYDPSLTPAATVGANTSYTYDVDYVRVSTVPEPASVSLMALAAITGWGLRRARRRSPA
jgi:beta-glucanase (GH16 family)